MPPFQPFDPSPEPIRRSDDSATAYAVHDLKNLLTIIAGCADALAERLAGRGGSEWIDLQRALDRAFLVAAELLGSNTGRINDRGTIDLNHAIVDLEGIVRRMLGPAIALRLHLA